MVERQNDSRGSSASATNPLNKKMGLKSNKQCFLVPNMSGDNFDGILALVDLHVSDVFAHLNDCFDGDS